MRKKSPGLRLLPVRDYRNAVKILTSNFTGDDAEILRRRALDKAGFPGYERGKCEFTGADILKPVGMIPLLTTEDVRETLSDFP